MYWPLGAPKIFAATKRKRDSASEPGIGEEQSNGQDEPEAILGLRVSRSGHLFATITKTTLSIWHTNSVVILASLTRSVQSLKQYGFNTSVLLRPDSSIAVIQTSLGFLKTYSVLFDQTARVYQQIHDNSQSRRQSGAGRYAAEEERRGLPEVNLRFRMVIKVDAGIAKVLALDDELVVATEKPAAVQCIRWAPDSAGHQTDTELLNRMTWLHKRASLLDMVHDRAMSLAVWITNEGKAYAVQRVSSASRELDAAKRLFRGYGFHSAAKDGESPVKAAINARFSLLALGCQNAEVWVYTARDYVGSIPLSHKLDPPATLFTTGQISSLSYSPDGYCLFAGFEKGWALWSVYGKLQATSFASETRISEANHEGWLQGVQEASWLFGGLGLLLSRQNDDRLWLMDLAKTAVTGCFCSANIARTVLQTESSLMVYRGYDLPIKTSLVADSSLWHHMQIPESYLIDQRPLRSVVISQDGRYLAVAGRRGLAHYSLGSGRWRTFEDSQAENAFVVRGGMCWYQHILIAAVETNEAHELRLYSRERALDDSSLLHVEQLPSPVVVISLTGHDSLLVYTYENVLYHFVIDASSATVSIAQVGQIALHGIVRAPARVRAVSWILPDHQIREGDPSQDVACASVLFLVDAKLVLLQSSSQGDDGLKYDMRIIANNVEYFDLMRDRQSLTSSSTPSPSPEQAFDPTHADRGLQDSLWYFDGIEMHCWVDVDDLVQAASSETTREIPPTVRVQTDFYPTSIFLSKGILLGLDADLVQRRDVHFAFFRFSVRSQLFLPPIFRHHLAQLDSAAASSLAHRYQQLPYFPHALEVLLHTVLDDEVDHPPDPDSALLPSVLSFLSSFPDYLDILVQCTRKTEVRSWRTLFATLPPPRELFDASLEKGLLKTAGGYLLVLHTFDENKASFEQCVQLLQRAKQASDWDLCKELARFLMALDGSGSMLKAALGQMDMPAKTAGSKRATRSLVSQRQETSLRTTGLGIAIGDGGMSEVSSPDGSFLSPGSRPDGDGDYFSPQ